MVVISPALIHTPVHTLALNEVALDYVLDDDVKRPYGNILQLWLPPLSVLGLPCAHSRRVKRDDIDLVSAPLYRAPEGRHVDQPSIAHVMTLRRGTTAHLQQNRRSQKN